MSGICGFMISPLIVPASSIVLLIAVDLLISFAIEFLWHRAIAKNSQPSDSAQAKASFA